jgi:hypothetical protein
MIVDLRLKIEKLKTCGGVGCSAGGGSGVPASAALQTGFPLRFNRLSGKRNIEAETTKIPNLFWSLDIGICDLFVIWCLGFVI